MKKIILILSVVVITLACLGYFFVYNSVFRADLAWKFDATVYISAKQSDAGKNIAKLEKLAKKHKVSFMKEDVIPSNSLDDISAKQKIDLYLFLNDAGWFDKAFRDVKIIKNTGGTNKFKEVQYKSMLTSKDINFYPYEKIGKNAFAGDYSVKGEKSNINSFIKSLNDSKSGIQAKKTESSAGSDLGYEEASLYIMFFLILLFALVFSIIIYGGVISKELGVIALLGHSKFKLCMSKAKEVLAISFFGSFIITNVLLCFLIKPQSLGTYLASVKWIYLINIGCSIAFAFFECCVLLFVAKGINFIDALKGYRKGHGKLTVVFKVATVTMVIYMLAATFFTTFNYLQVQPGFAKWEKSKSYINITFAGSAALEDGSGKKLKDDMPIRLSKLWDELDRRGALMYFPKKKDLEGLSEEESDWFQNSGDQAVGGNFAYINNNYLKYSKVRDINNNIINIDKIKPNEWIILKPASMKLTKKDKDIFKDDHSMQIQKKNKLCKETYINIKDDQSLFSFDSEQKIDVPNSNNKALILMNTKALSPIFSIKETSLVNCKIHPKVKNVNKAFEELKPLLSKYQLEKNVLYMSSVYDAVAQNLRTFRVKALVNLIGLFAALIILIALIKIDITAYFSEHGRRIDVSCLLGHGFASVHKNKLLKSCYSVLFSAGLFIVILILSVKFDLFSFFSPRAGWQLNDVVICICIALVGVACAFALEVIGLRRGDKDIATRLKEGN